MEASSIKNGTQNRLDRKISTKPKTLKTSPKNQKELKTSEATKRHTQSDKIRSSTKSIKRGNRLSKRLIEQSKPQEQKKYNILEILPVNAELEKAIAEIESNGTSSEPEELSNDSEEKEEQDSDLGIKQIYDLDLDIHSDEISLSEEDKDSNKVNQIENELDFFEIFGEVPHVDEVSLDLMDAVTIEEPKALVSDLIVVRNTGKFVDPLTGMHVQSLDATKSIESTTEQSLRSQERNPEESEKEEEQSQAIQAGISREENFEENVDEFENVRPSHEISDETFQLFLETMQQKEFQIIHETDVADAALLIDEENKNVIRHLLNNLVDHCVAKAEYLERDIMLRNFLDKNKLMNEIKSKYASLELEKRRSQFLNQKIVNFFRRKGSFRLITADDDINLAVYRNNFYATLTTLDEWLTKEEKTKTLNSTRISNLKNHFEEVKQQSNEEVDKLEKVIKTAFQRKTFEKLQTSVEKHLTKMSVIRKEISKVRLKLLLQQHKFSSLKKQMEKLEDLGNGLTVHHFEALETETYAISKKIEEHNSALKRLHHHSNDDVHKMAHLKEKQKMMRSIIVAQKQYYEDLLREKRKLREYITDLKVERNRFRYEIDELSYSSGLLAKPALMKDYDKTVERASKLRKANEDLRTTIQELKTKVGLFEKNCMV